MVKPINTKDAPAAIGPYSQGMIADIAANNSLIFSSGQIPVDPISGNIPEGIKAQAEQSCKNVDAILKASGSSMNKVIKTTCFIANMDDFKEFNEIYEKYFISKPARSCVAVKTLPKNVLCEIEAIAEK